MKKILIVLLLIAVGVYGYLYWKQQRDTTQTQEMLGIPNFSEEGIIQKNPNDSSMSAWYFAPTKTTIFSKTQKLLIDDHAFCIHEDERATCVPAEFLNGSRVSVAGQKTDEGIQVFAITFMGKKAAAPGEQKTAGSGQRCGGNTKDAAVCGEGLHCAPIPGVTAPFGDVGGLCVAN